MLSHFSHVRLCATPQTVARQSLLSMGFSRQEYWSGLPSASPGDLPNPGINPYPGINLLPLLHWQAGSLSTVPMLENPSQIILVFFFFLMYIKCETLQECNTFLNQSRRKQVMKLKNCLKNTSK